MTAMTAEEILQAAKTVLVVDWPSRDVPDTLARAGYEVVVHGGPAPDDYSTYVVEDGEVVVRRTGHPPVQAELVYSYRPVAELAEIVETALGLGARAVWVQLPAEDGEQARAIVETAGLAFVDGPSLPDAVRALGNLPS
jgi:predicted CoA-binding protein